MPETRPVKRVVRARPTMEGAGVRLRRAFGEVMPDLDPFLLLDDFGSSDPDDYMAGFPWHPHRGIETITYVISGRVAHGDSLGNKGVIGPGDVQWMTAGSGIVHEEMPEKSEELRGFQLWANLPKANKMMDPRYRDVLAKDIPVTWLAKDVSVGVVCGRVGEVAGPVRDIVTEPEYLDVHLGDGAELRHPIPAGHNAFAYLYAGAARFGGDKVEDRHLVVFGPGDEVVIEAVGAGARLLLVSGRPIGEPVAWGGPIVMNTQAELKQAFQEYEDGTFIKKGEHP